MAIVVIGGHSRSVGKTSVVAGLIAALPEFNWTALKITQFGHGICSADGKPCDCDTGDDHFRALSDEKDLSGESDTSRFLVAGAKRSLWVRTRQGRLGEAMPDIERKIARFQRFRPRVPQPRRRGHSPPVERQGEVEGCVNGRAGREADLRDRATALCYGRSCRICEGEAGREGLIRPLGPAKLMPRRWNALRLPAQFLQKRYSTLAC